jgi:hypothetical protein
MHAAKGKSEPLVTSLAGEEMVAIMEKNRRGGKL